MDSSKCELLKQRLASAAGPLLVDIATFFDGNDDLGSIGCNLLEHPGVAKFQEVLEGLLAREDVDAVYAGINEVDPGEGSWPFTDTVFVAGAIDVGELRGILAPLEPDEVVDAEPGAASEWISSRHSGRVVYAWWD